MPQVNKVVSGEGFLIFPVVYLDFPKNIDNVPKDRRES